MSMFCWNFWSWLSSELFVIIRALVFGFCLLDGVLQLLLAGCRSRTEGVLLGASLDKPGFVYSRAIWRLLLCWLSSALVTLLVLMEKGSESLLGDKDCCLIENFSSLAEFFAGELTKLPIFCSTKPPFAAGYAPDSIWLSILRTLEATALLSFCFLLILIFCRVISPWRIWLIDLMN